MFGVRVALLVVLATDALSQNADIFDRLRHALALSGQSDEAVRALREKKFAQVESILEQSKANTDATRAELFSLRAAVEFLNGEIGNSAVNFRAASNLAPLKDSDSFTLAMALVKLGDNTQARTLLVALSEKYPEKAVYPYWLGRLDYDQRRYQEAVKKFEKAVQLDPRSARIWDSLGLALDMQGEMEQARLKFDSAVSLNRILPHPSPGPPQDLGYLLLRMNQLQEAEVDLREALRYDAQLSQAHYYLARVLEKQGRDPEAIDEYSRAIALDAKSPEPCYSLGALYRKLNRSADAAAMFSEYKNRKEATRSFESRAH